ncbi:hypothetical protein V8C86DRAFT_2896566, partial [Haematococcus lacustris]
PVMCLRWVAMVAASGRVMGLRLHWPDIVALVVAWWWAAAALLAGNEGMARPQQLAIDSQPYTVCRVPNADRAVDSLQHVLGGGMRNRVR